MIPHVLVEVVLKKYEGITDLLHVGLHDACAVHAELANDTNGSSTLIYELAVQATSDVHHFI